MFVDPDGPDPNTFVDNDYHLLTGSPCVDFGDEDISVIPCDEFDVDGDGRDCVTDPEPTPDLDLDDRVLDGDLIGEPIVDMGASELPPCPWDCGDGDGTVGILDLLQLLDDWTMASPCDFDGGGVGILDLLILLDNWG